MKKNNFIESTFDNDSRNAFLDKNSKSVKEAVGDVFPMVIDEELGLYINDPMRLSKVYESFRTFQSKS